MPKDMNPQKSLELHPIAKFKAIMKTELRKHPKTIKTELELKKILVTTTKILGNSVEKKFRAFGMGDEIE